MEERGETEDEIRSLARVAGALVVDGLVEHLEGVLVDILVAVVLVRLQLHRRQLGEHVVREAALDEQIEARARLRGAQQLGELVAHALDRDVEDPRGHVADGGERGIVEAEAELGGEADGAHHAERVVAERDLGGHGRAQHLGEEVVDAAGRIHQHHLRQAHGQRVHREVAAHEVLLERRAELDLGLPGDAVVLVRAVGRDLDLLPLHARADGAEGAADVPVGVGDGLHDLEDAIRSGVGGEVEVRRGAAEEGVAHGAADECELVARLVEGAREHGDRGRCGQLAETLEGLCDAVHGRTVYGGAATGFRRPRRAHTGRAGPAI